MNQLKREDQLITNPDLGCLRLCVWEDSPDQYRER